MFRDIYEAAPDAIFLVGRDGTILLANAEAHRVFGYDPGSLLGVSLELLLPEALRAAHSAHRETYFTAPRKRRMGEWLNLTARRRSGESFPVDISLGPFGYRGEPAVLSVVRDITERKALEQALQRTEAQLRHFQKMQAIGVLAGGVAHDFNNLLSVILSYANLILETLPEGSPLRTDIGEILKAGERADGLTKQLLAFSRRQILKPTVVDLHRSLTDMSRMLRRLLDADYVLSLSLDAQNAKVHADPGQFEQVVMNLVVNARDAMGEGGAVVLRTSNVTLDRDYAAEHVEVEPGDYMLLEVIDDGVGMDSATRDRIFEPFFTTKELGKGTGLGLSTVYGIVRQMSGHITVQSTPGRGTTFQVYFPITSAAPQQSPAKPSGKVVLGGTETVLLVDDDDQVRTIVRAILHRHGYQVLDAQNAGEAFLICEKYDGRIDLLVTDVVMPRMSGLELATRLLPMRPGMKVLYMSGYTENAIVHRAGDTSIAFFQKPIVPAPFLTRVREVLDGADVTSSKSRS